MKYLVIIPARSGSKGVPNKNKKILGGKPLIEYTILSALSVFKKEEICVSTNDPEIYDLCKKKGIEPPFMRPEELSTDFASSNDVVEHALNYFELNKFKPDILVLLQPTSPFRTAEHIKEALKLYNEEIDMLVSVCESKANPYFNLFEENNKGYLEKSKSGNFTRRQDCPSVFEYNGAIYIINVNSFKKEKIGTFKKIQKFLMDEISSHDIDTMFDWEIAEILINKSI